jgi:hypothetical protein
MTDRYSGKPFLRLLDCYVLNAIGMLDEAQINGLKAMEPKLAQVFGIEGSWTDIVASKMEFPDDLPAEIRRIWEAGRAKASTIGLEVDPAEFTRQFVDTNFAHGADGFRS